MKQNAAMPMDYSKRRHQPEKDDLELSAAGLTWLASIEQPHGPSSSPQRFPDRQPHGRSCGSSRGR